MRVKKTSLVLVVLFLVFSVGIGSSVYAMEPSSSKNVDEYAELGKEFLYDYYHSVDMKQDMNISKYVKDDNVLQYVDLKHEILTNRKVRSNIDVTSFSLDVSIHDYQVLDNNVDITYNVLVKHQYKGLDQLSESMRQVKLGFTNENETIGITDYFEYTDFDIMVSLKQQNADPSQSLKVNTSDIRTYQLDYSKNPNEFLKTTLSNENKFFDKLDSEISLYKLNGVSHNAATTNSVSLASVSSTARSNIVTYAIANSSKTEPSSGNSSYASYYDFSAIANDCTNFVSHSLLAGGAKENRTSWYYDSLSARTPSWAGVNEFHDFITNNTATTGPKAESKPLAYACPPQYVNWENGDIIQIKYSVYGYPGFGHSTIVTGSYAPNYNTQYPLITSRTGDYSYNTNEVLTNVYPIDGADVLAYRLIHLTAIQ
ncbi:amidase domain-containing protein [Paenibacillus tepidiphilus]|uniref:amidase domain-containing protein n=1 Tax=Paenibacillus tepidiphilus TaxID=2608683 RepID=UPI00123933E2|nr:amidase domain-containing protein [Paenibacillus tepidiphilus]